MALREGANQTPRLSRPLLCCFRLDFATYTRQTSLSSLRVPAGRNRTPSYHLEEQGNLDFVDGFFLRPPPRRPPKEKRNLTSSNHGGTQGDLQVLPAGLRPGKSAARQEGRFEHAQGQDDAPDVHPVRHLRDLHGQGEVFFSFSLLLSAFSVFLFHFSFSLPEAETEAWGKRGVNPVEEMDTVPCPRKTTLFL